MSNAMVLIQQLQQLNTSLCVFSHFDLSPKPLSHGIGGAKGQQVADEDRALQQHDRARRRQGLGRGPRQMPMRMKLGEGERQSVCLYCNNYNVVCI